MNDGIENPFAKYATKHQPPSKPKDANPFAKYSVTPPASQADQSGISLSKMAQPLAEIGPDIGKSLSQAGQEVQTGERELFGRDSTLGQRAKGAVDIAGGIGSQLGAVGKGATQALFGDPARRTGLPGSQTAASVAEFGGSMVSPGTILKAGKAIAEAPAVLSAAEKVGEAAKEAGKATKLSNLRLGAQEAHTAGYRLPPAAAKLQPGESDAALSAASGDAKLDQRASVINQANTNRLARQDLGLAPGQPLLPETFKQVRKEAGKAYQAVTDAVPEVQAKGNKEFAKAINDMDSMTKELKEAFPNMPRNPEIEALKQEFLGMGKVSTSALVDRVKQLRADSTKHFKSLGQDPKTVQLAIAERKAADAIENLVDHGVKNADQYWKGELKEIGDNEKVAGQRLSAATNRMTAAQAELARTQGEPFGHHSAQVKLQQAQKEFSDAQTAAKEIAAKKQAAIEGLQKAQSNTQRNVLVQRLQEARTRIAKSYDYELAANETTGDVNARRLATLLDKGRPFTGNIATIAKTGRAFPQAMREPSTFGGLKDHSVIDYLATIGFLSHGHAVPAAAVVARPLARRVLLSKAYQNRMIPTPKTDLEALSSK